MPQKKIHVALDGGGYDIHIGSGLLSALTDYVPAALGDRALFVLTDENVSAVAGLPVYGKLKFAKPSSVQMLALPPGEQTKSWQSLERVLAWILDHGVSRGSVLFAVGGGVIGDLGGLAAALALRGISYVQVPTTLLAQVDSAVGGKTAIDMPQGKNLVGAFYQPLSVICDTDLLQSLPRREILAGYAEILKYALIGDHEFFLWLEEEGKNVCDLDGAALVDAIETSCRKKAEIVARDEKEGGVRMLLNLGHTFGHALESAAGYDGKRLLHGEAVAIGMVMAFRLSARLGLCADLDADRVEAHIAAIGLPTKVSMIFPPLSASIDDIVGFMKRDKKTDQGHIRFVLARGIGDAFVADDVPMDDVKEIISLSMEGA